MARAAAEWQSEWVLQWVLSVPGNRRGRMGCMGAARALRYPLPVALV